jgi:hypothetical protein
MPLDGQQLLAFDEDYTPTQEDAWQDAVLESFERNGYSAPITVTILEENE